MSALLTKRGPFPAVAFAAAFAAATPPAGAGAVIPGSTAVSEEIAALLAEARAASAERAMALLGWASSVHVDWRRTATAAADIEGQLAAGFTGMQDGFVLLRLWAEDAARDIIRRSGATWREAAAIVRLAQLAHAAETDEAYVQIADAARTLNDSVEILSEAAEAQFRPVQRRLSAFVIKAQTQTSPEPPRSAFARAMTQPFFDVYGAVISIEASVRRTVDWNALAATLDKAEALAVQRAALAEEAPVSLHVELVDRLAAVAAGFAELRAMIESNVRIMAAAKVQFLALLNDANRLALNEMPRREARRVLKTRPVVEPAVMEPGAVRHFGRRIDFDGLAHRYLTGDEH